MHLRWRSLTTRSQSSASRRAEATQRSAIEFARGLRAGVRRTFVPSAGSTESKAEPLQEDGIDREEVGGDDRGGVGGKEAAPAERGATGRRRDAVLTQDPANGAGRDLEAELAELAP